MWNAPCTSRSETERTDSFSTVPVVPPTVITSPTLMTFSNWMNTPVMMSCTIFCAPKPIARPKTPAEASSGPISSPISLSTNISVRMISVMVAALRSKVSRVVSREVGTAPYSGFSL